MSVAGPSVHRSDGCPKHLSRMAPDRFALGGTSLGQILRLRSPYGCLLLWVPSAPPPDQHLAVWSLIQIMCVWCVCMGKVFLAVSRPFRVFKVKGSAWTLSRQPVRIRESVLSIPGSRAAAFRTSCYYRRYLVCILTLC